MGDSAGGCYTLSILNQAIDNNISLPACAVVFSPPVQFLETLPSYKNNLDTDCVIDSTIQDETDIELFQDNLECKKSSTMGILFGDIAKWCPIYISVSSSEFLYDESLLLKKKLEENNIEFEYNEKPNLMHAYPSMPIFKESKDTLKSVFKFINKHIK